MYISHSACNTNIALKISDREKSRESRNSFNSKNIYPIDRSNY